MCFNCFFIRSTYIVYFFFNSIVTKLYFYKKFKMNKKLFFTFFIVLNFIVSFSQNDTILIDFGTTTSPFPWNNVTDAKTGQVGGLLNVFGSTTNFGIEVFDAFNSINNDGTQSANPSLGLPSSVSEDSFYGNTVSFNGEIQSTGGVELTNLNTAEQYTITIFSSRLATDNRETKYVLTGSNQQSLYLNASNNTNSVVTATMYPAFDGTIKITASPGANNNNSNGFFYLGAIKVIFKKERSLKLITPNGGEFWQVGKTVPITWNSLNVAQVTLDYSINNGASWINIGSVSAPLNSYDWIIPNTPSNQCLVRITSDTLSDVSDANFEISPDNSVCRIVVLGSSTAAGQGPSTIDSAWVNRYTNYLYNKNTSFEVVNLAQGGYNTYKIIPTGTPKPSWVGTTADPNRNLTKALTYNPYAIIVNMPSNDAAGNIPVSEQLFNFKAIVDSAALQGVKTWVTTTQPRNFTNQFQIQLQKDVRDSILSIYGDYAIDFWTGTAQTNGFILGIYDSGDGVHMNSKGHRLLLAKMAAKMIDTLCGNTANPSRININDLNNLSLILYPNPTNTYFQLETEEEVSSIKIFNNLGMEVETLTSYTNGNEILIEHYKKGIYFVVVKTKKGIYNKKLVVN